MIITDIEQLRQVSIPTNAQVCKEAKIFERLEKELNESKQSGVGLSAIQIGVPIQVCILRHKSDRGGYSQDLKLNMINSVIIEETGELKRCNGEGCLSLPGVRVDTERYDQVTVSWFDYDQDRMMQGVFIGFEAQIVQHELDHLSGVLVIDRKIKEIEEVGRNDPCSCGSGKKYKKCCLK